mgnify:CR=1 FL=1
MELKVTKAQLLKNMRKNGCFLNENVLLIIYSYTGFDETQNGYKPPKVLTQNEQQLFNQLNPY